MVKNQTQVEISSALETQRLTLQRSRGQLVQSTGLSYQSLQKILDGTSDFKVSNLLAIANSLGMEVALVPRGLGPAVAAASPSGATPDVVSAALARLRPLGKPGRGKAAA